jgi:ATP adenylyltransferase
MLWQQIELATRRALRTAALQPIATCQERVRDEGVEFLIREVASLRNKLRNKLQSHQPGAGQGAAQGQGQEFESARVPNPSRPNPPRPNPFLPYDPRLFVADASPTHVCLLNKFPVVEHHLLIVTRAFEPQASPLGERDFEAWWSCLRQYPSLGFYNGGEAAGASQPHKHLQLIPLPLAPWGPAVPIEPLLAPHSSGDDHARLHGGLPFTHAFRRFTGADTLDSRDRSTSGRLQAIYRELLDACHLQPDPRNCLPAYNLLLTRQWMLLVPRIAECCGSISVNGLGLAGALLVRDAAERERLKSLRPMNVLRAVTAPWGT